MPEELGAKHKDDSEGSKLGNTGALYVALPENPIFVAENKEARKKIKKAIATENPKGKVEKVPLLHVNLPGLGGVSNVNDWLLAENRNPGESGTNEEILQEMNRMRREIEAKGKEVLSSKLEWIKITTQKTKLESKTAELEVKVLSLEKCLNAKDDEVGSLRRLKENHKLEKRETIENAQREIAGKDLEISELVTQQTDAKKLNATINKQKLEINRLRMTSEQLIKKKVELEKKVESLGAKLQHESEFGRMLILREKVRPAAPLPSARDEKKCSIPVFTAPKGQQRGWTEQRGKKTNNPQKIKTSGKTTTRPTKKNKKIEVLIVGDDSVRNIGELLQNPQISSYVAVRGGIGLQGIREGLPGDTAVQERAIVLSVGNEEIKCIDSDQVINNLNDLITSMEQASNPCMALLPLLPQRELDLDRKVGAVNRFMRERCRDSNVIVMDTNLNVWDTSRNGAELSTRGRAKVTATILNVIPPTVKPCGIPSITTAPAPAQRV